MDKTVVDYGCGSGVLAIAALKLGAAAAIAVDVDPRAVQASNYNAERNGVSERMLVHFPDEASGDPADILVANILANEILSLRPTLSALFRPGGFILLTEILNSPAARVVETFMKQFQFHDRWQREWCLLIGGRSAVSSAYGD